MANNTNGEIETTGLISNLSTYWQGIPEAWQTTIVSITIPLLISFLVWLSIKLWKKITHKPDLLVSTDDVYIDRLPDTEVHGFIGRSDTINKLQTLWQESNTAVVMLHGVGGEGKTAIIRKWLESHAKEKWKEMPRVYAWSFQNQGDKNKFNPSSEQFVNHALVKFDNDIQEFPSEYEKGKHLSRLISKHKTLMILDGIEAFQNRDHDDVENHGTIRDRGLLGFIEGMLKHNNSLCLLTSRESLNQQSVEHNNAINISLSKLTESEAIELLKSKKVKGRNRDFQDAAREFNYHAHSLTLLGNFMSKKDIGKRDVVLGAVEGKKLRYQMAEGIMFAYQQQLLGKNKPALALLYVLSLFEDKVEVKVIQHLVEKADQCGRYMRHLKSLKNDKLFKQAINYLQRIDLLRIGKGQTNIDCHPIVKTFFNTEFKRQYPYSLLKTHKVLYRYYKAMPDKEEPKSADEMSHLFAAVVHGCAAGLHQEVVVDVYWPRILRQGEHYITHKLGAFSTDLAVVSHFFDKPWQRTAEGLTDDAKAWLPSVVAFRLRALGRLEEAVEPFQASLEIQSKQEDWTNAASAANSLSELQLTRGDIPKAKAVAQQSVELADRSEDMFYRMMSRNTQADAYHQAGDWTEAQTYFEKAEALQQERQPNTSQLYSLQGFRYCDLLLTTGQWQEVQQRASQALEWAKQQGTLLLDISLNQLLLGRSSLQAVYLECPKALFDSTIDTTQWQTLNMPPEAMVITQNDLSKAFTVNQQINESQQSAIDWLNQAVEGLRKAGDEQYVPRGLLARSSYARFATLLEDSATEQALYDLQETHEIAHRGGMKLHLSDYHLEASRLALTIDADVHEQIAAEHLAKAKALVEETGYHRRDGEVTYLEGLLSG